MFRLFSLFDILMNMTSEFWDLLFSPIADVIIERSGAFGNLITFLGGEQVIYNLFGSITVAGFALGSTVITILIVKIVYFIIP